MTKLSGFDSHGFCGQIRPSASLVLLCFFFAFRVNSCFHGEAGCQIPEEASFFTITNVMTISQPWTMWIMAQATRSPMSLLTQNIALYDSFIAPYIVWHGPRSSMNTSKICVLLVHSLSLCISLSLFLLLSLSLEVIQFTREILKALSC